MLGQLYTLALEAQGYTVQLNQNIGPTSVTLDALRTGALDMYPEYLNTFNTTIAHTRRRFPNEFAAYAAAQRYAEATRAHPAHRDAVQRHAGARR